MPLIPNAERDPKPRIDNLRSWAKFSLFETTTPGTCINEFLMVSIFEPLIKSALLTLVTATGSSKLLNLFKKPSTSTGLKL